MHYDACIEIGQRRGSTDATFWGRNGHCLLVQGRGNLPRSELLLQRLVVWAERRARPDLAAHATHGLAITVGLRGRLRESLRHLEAALSASSSIDWGRILLNIGYTHMLLGELEQARDVFLGLIATVNDSYETSISSYKSHRRLRGLWRARSCREFRRHLESQALLPPMTVDFQLTLGRAYSTLDDPASAKPCFERAGALAHRIGIGRAVIEADQALARLSQPRSGGGVQNRQPVFRVAHSREYSTALPRLWRPPRQ